MQQYKVDNYQKVHTDRLDVNSLNSTQREYLIDMLFMDLDISKESGNSLFQNIDASIDDKSELSSANTVSGFIDLEKRLQSELNLSPDHFYLIWNSEMIDFCSSEVLRLHWDDIWYGEGDEALIMYVPHEVAVIIFDWGGIGIKKIGSE